MGSRCRHQEQPRRAKAATCDDGHGGVRLLEGALLVVVARAACAAVGADDYLAHPRVRTQVDSIRERARPVRQVGGRQRPLRPSEWAPAEADAGGEAPGGPWGY